MSSSPRLDFLLLGATGFTGSRCIPFLNEFCQSGDQNFTWGIAGRSKSKLEQTLVIAGRKTLADFQKIPIVIVDVTDNVSLAEAVRKAKVVINCCGPFALLGAPIVKACIAAETHYVDISAEPNFMEKMELELKEEAKDKGVYIVTACGFDCLPTDLGVVFLQQQFQGTLNSVDTYLEVWLEDGTTSRSIIGYNSNSIINICTWESLVHSVGNWKEIIQIREKLFPEIMSKFQPRVRQRFVPHISRVVKDWSVPLPTADASSVKRTQKFFYEVEQKRPIQTNTYFITKSFFEVFLIALFAILMFLFTTCAYTRSVLIRYPALFTFGTVRRKPVTDKVVRNTWYQTTFYGEGWSDNVGPNDYQYSKPCDKCILGKVKGKDGYKLTCVGVVLSAIIILTEKHKLPQGGGVFSAGACFAKTSLIEQLIEHGVEFEIIHQRKL